ncbi:MULTISPECIES: DUF3488 domain-containing protein [Nitrospirillum]|uniref:Dolichyl-phosphate-mannose-protein mannosyltransferase n=1 Tax=Nitrospirillum amazonense TaxID=28077 RepID=A0A560FXP8_9PROT|nr:hypothetical protein [Nitrospirillum amazonense]MEC4593556.1 hypothetical protein [Nitrospirillum amazonense]TWB26407.1 hypothetical protein FBZ88_108172 [Nitrospirillum amazonense]
MGEIRRVDINNILAIAFWPVGVVVSLVGVLYALAHPHINSGYYSSDGLYVLSFWQAVRDHTLKTFHFSHLPDIFPEHLIIIPLLEMGVPWKVAFFLFCVLSVLGFLAACRVVLRGLQVGVAGQWLMVALFAGLAARRDLAHLQFIAIGVHLGSFALSFMMAAYAQSRLHRPWTIPALLAWNVAICLAAFSDALFVWEFVLPFLAGLAAMAIAGRAPWRSAAILGISAVAATGLGVGLLHTLPISPFPPATLSVVLERARLFVASAPPEMMVELFVPLVFALVAYLARFWFGGIEGAASGQVRRRTDAELFSWHFGLIAALATLAVTMAAYEEQGTFRYTAAAWWWPPLLCIAAVRDQVNRKAPWVTSVAAVTITTSVALAAILPFPKVFFNEDLAQCLEREGANFPLKSGLGHYWVAHPVTVFTESRVFVSTVDGSGDPWMWLNNRTDYFNDSKMTAPREYNFVIMRYLDRGAVQSRYGEPDDEIHCGSDTILYYRDSKRLTDYVAQWMAQHPKA